MLERYRGNETILVVDDEPVVLNLARSILTRCGYTVFDYQDPKKAIDDTRDTPFDLVLTDIVMPEITGPDLVREIKAARPDVACIYMSGYDVHQIASRGVVSSCDYLRKPFTPEGLAQRVRATLEEKTAPPDA